MESMKVTFVVLICMVVVGAPIAQATITCTQVAIDVAPCLTYLRTGGNPSGACCSGVKNLVASAKTTADRRAACTCLKNFASGISGYNDANAQALPGKCGFSLPYKISTSTNCATFHQLISEERKWSSGDQNTTIGHHYYESDINDTLLGIKMTLNRDSLFRPLLFLFGYLIFRHV
ncbi:hypothetical protein RIF29_28734 [Crotalaria pallida]|uniref:Non-specific lipid-transfer protein n=1 Tax=Crotalaria pallida TaxID=3830 RepID=A0AAN9EDA8_CROPI